MSLILKKCLMIGINYKETKFELNGCINDCDNLKKYLINNTYFNEDEVIQMTDEKKDYFYPTKTNILYQLRKLVTFARQNINKLIFLFVSYSGHGTYVKDTNGDELDGKDEAICPIDCDTKGYITDDVLREVLINNLPANVRLTVLIDACHSGTMLDLKYNYLLDKNNTQISKKKSIASKCQVVMISGCRDDQTSSDAYLQNKLEKKYEYQGAMTSAFLNSYKDNISYKILINNMRKWLKENNFEQVPQLSSGKSINMDGRFLLSGYN
jgi:hypothetical protein